jgi:hypothetical protein
MPPGRRRGMRRRGSRERIGRFIDFQYCYSVAAKDETRLSVNKRIPGVYTACVHAMWRKKKKRRKKREEDRVHCVIRYPS